MNSEQPQVNTEIQQMDIGALERVCNINTLGCYSRIFLVPKKYRRSKTSDGSQTPEHLFVHKKVQMEIAQTITRSLSQGIDVIEAFFTFQSIHLSDSS